MRTVQNVHNSTGYGGDDNQQKYNKGDPETARATAATAAAAGLRSVHRTSGVVHLGFGSRKRRVSITVSVSGAGGCGGSGAVE